MALNTRPALPGKIIRPDGTTAELPAYEFTSEEARILRAMKKILLKYGWKTLYRCEECFRNGQPDDLVQGGVTDERIGFICHHQQVVFRGQTV